MPESPPSADMLRQAVEDYGGVNRAADGLGIPRTTFKRWLANQPSSNPRCHIKQPTEPPPGWEEQVWEALPDWEALLRRGNTEVDCADIEIETDLPIGIACTSDWHIGNAGTYHALIRTVYKRIVSTPGLYFVCNGDLVDNFVALSHETGRYEQVLRPALQKRLAAWVIEQTAPCLLAVTGGQHEYFEERVSDFDTAQYIGRKGGAAYLGAGGSLNLLVGQQPYRLGLWHRYKGSSIYDRNADAKRLFRDHGEFDVVITGDKHEPAISHCIEQGAYRVFVRSGTTKLEDRYGKSLGYTQAAGQEYLATPVVILWPDRREFCTFLRFDQACDYLNFLRGGQHNV